MRHRSGSGPVRIILVPGNNAAVMGGFVKDLVVPKAHCRSEQLRGGHQERRIPKQVVKCRTNTPSTKRMKESSGGVSRFVGIVFVEEFASGMGQVSQSIQFASKSVDLLITQHAYAGEVSVLLIEIDLLIRETILIPLPWLAGPREKIAHR